MDLSDDIPDSRDLQDRLDDLEADDQGDLSADEHAEMVAIRGVRDATADEGWKDGIAFVRESHFEEHARELADDLDLIPADASWPLTCIDWARAARELRYDYSAIEISGITYFYREA